MKTKSLEILERADLPPGQAKAILEVMELEMEDSRATLATHEDLARLETLIHGTVQAAKTDMIKWTVGCFLTQTGLMLGLFYFLIERSGR